ncbi:MAG: aminodeoxychorismate/anthranilate synthase component II [Planctomycetota bacterium]
MIVVLDNYDSFVHNLARLLRLAGAETLVRRSDAIDCEELLALSPAGLVISPGPGAPADAGCSVEAVRGLGDRLPILGVCLGHQAIVAAYGGTIDRATDCFHGRTSVITHSGVGLFAGAPSPLTVCRYHSLAANAAELPDGLKATAHTKDGVIMAVERRDAPVYGVQFHPEAILTESGQQMINNFVAVTRATPR